MRNPWAVQGFLDAAVAGPDDIGGHGADKGIKRLCADRIHHAFSNLLRIETCGGEPFGQRSFVIGADLWTAHMVRSIAGAAGDVRGDRTRAKHRDVDIGAFQFDLQSLGQ